MTSYTYDQLYNKPTGITDPRGLVAVMNYDAATGNLLQQVADFGNAPHFNATSTFAYNGIGQVLSATDPLGSATRYGYDSYGNRTSITRDAGSGRLNLLTQMSYSAAGDVTWLTDPNGKVTANTYDAARRLITTTSPATPAAPNGVVTALSYDADGRVLATQQSASGKVLRTTSATYTLTGQRATATDANGNVTSYTYDLADRLARVTDAMGRLTSYAYDALSRQTKVLNPAIQSNPLLQQGYTPDGLRASLTDANGNTTSFAYDGLDRLATTTYPGGGSTETFSYDADGNVLSRKTRANATIAFAYDTLNRLITKTPPAPAPVVSYSYDLAGRLTGVSDTSAAITSAAPPAPNTQYATTYGYDSLNRPTVATWSPAATQAATAASTVTFAHSYSKTNQRTAQTTTDNSWWFYPAPASTVSYTSNALNQYTAVGAVTPTYDGNGNLTGDGTFSYGYDAENRLTSAAGAGTTAIYAYDGQGRRKLKTVNGTTTVFITDAGNREVLEYDGASGQVLRWYAYGLGPNDVLNQMNVAAATRATFVPDIQGSLIATLDSSSTAPSKRGYLPYGVGAGVTGTFAYTGQRIDPETNGLYYYRARMYAPAWGRFMQVDPIGYAGGSNLYAYVGNDPTNLIDATGLWSLDINILVVGFSIGVGEKSGQPFVAFRGGIVGVGATYDPTADIPVGSSGQPPGSCTYCSVSRVYWETSKAGVGAVAGPINVSLLNKQGSTLVNEYNTSGLLSSTITPGT